MNYFHVFLSQWIEQNPGKPPKYPIFYRNKNYECIGKFEEFKPYIFDENFYEYILPGIVIRLSDGTTKHFPIIECEILIPIEKLKGI